MQVKVSGLEEAMEMLKSLESRAEGMAQMALYKGAGELADGIRTVLGELESSKEVDHHNRVIITQEQKEDLIEGFGIAPFRFKDGKYDTNLGFNGYTRQKTKRYPQGVPIQLLARSMESGTSFRMKQPFMRRAVKQYKDKAIEAMSEAINEEIRKAGGK